MTWIELATGSTAAASRLAIPNSVSVPRTRGVMGNFMLCMNEDSLEIMTGGDRFNLARLCRSAADCPDVDYFLALLSSNFGPVIGIGRIGQVFVFLEFLTDGSDQVF